MSPAAYVLQRHGQVKDVGIADGEARPHGLRPARVRHPAAGRRRALPRLRGAAGPPDRADRRRRLDGPRRRREPRGPAAALGGLPGRRPVGARGSCSRTSPAASTTAPARSSSSCRRARSSPRSAGTACTGCAAGSRRRASSGRSGATYSHAPEIYSISAAPMGARLPSTHAARVEREILGVSDGTPGQNFPLRHQPVLKLGTGETLEVQDPESGDWSRWECAPGLRRLDRVRPPLRARPRSAARSSSARRSARPTAAGRSTARSRPRARSCASRATATAAGARATSRPTR